LHSRSFERNLVTSRFAPRDGKRAGTGTQAWFTLGGENRSCNGMLGQSPFPPAMFRYTRLPRALASVACDLVTRPVMKSVNGKVIGIGISQQRAHARHSLS